MRYSVGSWSLPIHFPPQFTDSFCQNCELILMSLLWKKPKLNTKSFFELFINEILKSKVLSDRKLHFQKSLFPTPFNMGVSISNCPHPQNMHLSSPILVLSLQLTNFSAFSEDSRDMSFVRIIPNPISISPLYFCLRKGLLLTFISLLNFLDLLNLLKIFFINIFAFRLKDCLLREIYILLFCFAPASCGSFWGRVNLATARTNIWHNNKIYSVGHEQE